MDFDLEKLLSENDPKARPSKLLYMEDPETGEPAFIVPEDKKEEKALQKSLSPTGKEAPSKANPKMLAGLPEAVPEKMLANDNFNWDKEKIKQMIMGEESGLEQLKESIQGLKKAPPDINWKPFAAFLDAGVKGQNIAGSFDYESPENRAQRIAQLEDLLQKRRGEATGNALDLLKNSLYKQQLSDQRQERFQEAQGLKKEDQLRKDVFSVMTPVEEAEQMFSTMDENLGSGDYQGVMNSLSNFSRSIAGEKGVLTDQDVKRVMPSTFKGDVARFFTYFGSQEAKFDPGMIGRMQELIQIAKKRTIDKAQQQLEMRRKVYQSPSSKYKDLSAPGGVGDVIFSEAGKRLQTLKSPAAGASGGEGPTGLPSFEDFKKMKAGQ